MGFQLKIGLAIVFILSSAIGALAEDNETNITVLVYDHVRVPQKVLGRAEQEAARILRMAGIRIAWVDCTSGDSAQSCHRLLGPGELVLHIVADSKNSSDSIFGVAFPSDAGIGRYANVFFCRLQEMAHTSDIGLARLLGGVAAHEIGHLLLGTHSHSPFGIMAARWKQDELRRLAMGSLQFSSEQAERMRKRLLAFSEPGRARPS